MRIRDRTNKPRFTILSKVLTKCAFLSFLILEFEKVELIEPEPFTDVCLCSTEIIWVSFCQRRTLLTSTSRVLRDWGWVARDASCGITIAIVASCAFLAFNGPRLICVVTWRALFTLYCFIWFYWGIAHYAWIKRTLQIAISLIVSWLSADRFSKTNKIFAFPGFK